MVARIHITLKQKNKKLTSKAKVHGLVNSFCRFQHILSSDSATILLESILGMAVNAPIGVDGRGVIPVVAMPADRPYVIETTVGFAAGDAEPARRVELLGRGCIVQHDQGRDREVYVIVTAKQLLRSALRRLKRIASRAIIVVTGRVGGRVRRTGHWCGHRSSDKRRQYAAQEHKLHHLAGFFCLYLLSAIYI